MGLTKEEAEIQCDWASTLGLSPTGPEDGAAVIQACGVGHRRNRKKTNGDTTQVSLQQDTTPVTESEFLCLLPLCSFLEASGGEHTAAVVKEIASHLQSTCTVIHHQANNPAGCQKALTAVLNKLNSIMKLGALPATEMDVLSQAVHDLIMACLAPENEASSTFTIGYCVLRALSREPSLENGLPMLPLHAVGILQWLRTHFYADGASCSDDDTSAALQGLRSTSFEHISDEKLFALTLPLVSSTIPVDTGTELLVSPRSVHVEPGTLHRIVSFSCDAVRQALWPVLESAVSGMSISGATTPDNRPSSRPRPTASALLVRSASKLATQLVSRLWRLRDQEMAPHETFGNLKNEVTKVLNMMLEVAEACVKSAREYGTENVLSIAVQMLLECMELTAASMRFGGYQMDDILSRLRSLMMLSACLAEDQAQPDNEGTSSQGSFRSRSSMRSAVLLDVEVACGWDVSRSFVEQSKAGDPSSSLILCQVAAEALCRTLAAAWDAGHKKAVRDIAIPLGNRMMALVGNDLATCAEKQVATMSLGRLFVLVNGDQEMARLLLPLLLNGMLGSEKAPIQVYACLVHVMAAIGGVSGQKNFSSCYDQVVEQLIKLYKDPGSSGCKGLMYAYGGDGKYRGAMANALLQLAKLMQKGTEKARRDLRLKLLALFSDFGFKLIDMTPVHDLGALLPAIAAACEGLGKSFTPVLRTKATPSFRALEGLHEDSGLLIKYFRIFWLYSSLHNFAGIIKHNHTNWPIPWRTALGSIAQSTPALAAIDGPNRTEEMQETLRAELGDRLESVGRGASPENLERLLKETVIPYGDTLTVPIQSNALTPYLLATATVELCRAALGPLPSAEHAPSVVPIMSHISAVPSKSVEAVWNVAIAQKVFDLHLDRLQCPRGVCIEGATPSSSIDPQDIQERLAEVLISNLTAQYGHEDDELPEVVQVSSDLLKRLLRSSPSLTWSHRCIKRLMTSLGQEETANATMSGEARNDSGIVYKWVVSWIKAAATAAPARAEALLQEHLRYHGQSPEGMTLARTEDLLAVISRARKAKSPSAMIGSSNDFMKGLSRKSYYVGRISALQEIIMGDHSDAAAKLAMKVADALEDALKRKMEGRDLEDRYLQAAAMLLMFSGKKLPHRLLKSLCWVPVKRFNTGMMSLATFSWEWLVMGSPELTVDLLAEVVDAWVCTVQQKRGIFSRSVCEQDNSADANCLEGINAHKLWLSFLLEQWEVAKTDSSTLAYSSLYGRLLHHSLCNPAALTHHPAAAGARFNLLTLGLKYCEFFSKKGKRHIPAEIVYERVIKAGLAWFESPPAWYGRWNCKQSEEEVLAVSQFERDLRYWIGQHKQSGAHNVLLSVWGKSGLDSVSAEERCNLLLRLCQLETQRLEVWSYPLPSADHTRHWSETATTWKKHTRAAWGVTPKLALALAQRFMGVQSIVHELFDLVSKSLHNTEVQALSMAAMVICTSDSNKRKPIQGRLHALRHWAPASTANALMLLSCDAARSNSVREYAIKSLKNADATMLSFYLPQLVQCLREDSEKMLEDFLVRACQESWVFCHRLIWYLRSEFKPPDEALNPEIKRSGWKPPADTGLWGLTERVHGRIYGMLSPKDAEFLDAEMKYFDKITSISGILKPVPKDERRSKIAEELRLIELPRQDLYLPTNPDARVLHAVPESGSPMPSKEKMPILVQFAVKVGSPRSMTPSKQACIFKVGDDVRQDVLALQIIKILGDAFKSAGLSLYVAPYGVIPTGYERGIIEVVPNSKSRSALGETTDGGLYEIFQREFGPPRTPQFEAGRRKFMESEAGYCVASYLLQCKDRHNGNILIDSEGHIVHIDFGFILQTSPGGNLGFEAADFKLSHEMAQLLDPGGLMTSPFFNQFEALCVRGFLAARSKADSIMACIALMRHSGLPCYIGKAVDNMYARLHLDKTEAQVASIVKDIIKNSYCHWTTAFYDKIQNYTY